MAVKQAKFISDLKRFRKVGLDSSILIYHLEDVESYGIRTPDALLVATVLGEKAEALLTNDADLRRLEAGGVAVVILDDYV